MIIYATGMSKTFNHKIGLRLTQLLGGNGQDVPNWYVGYLPSLGSAAVVHEGTSPDEIESILVDANFFFDELNPTYFPGIGTSIKGGSSTTDLRT
jgi:hypothetical protein